MTDASAPAGGATLPAALAAAVAGFAGFAVMALELTAVRLLAPHFGDSAYVWTNVIGVILVALALGAFLGGRLADSGRGRHTLAMLLFSAGLFTALVPFFARPLASWAVGEDLRLDAALPALISGSLLSTLLLFALPVLLVGCVTPMLVRLVAISDGRIGRASGLVGAWSTIGSLVGTFAATHAMVPNLGARSTVWICGALFVVAAALCFGRTRRGASAAMLAVILALALPFVDLGPMRLPAEGEKLLVEVQSRYQYLQVVETRENKTRTTALKINEGLDSYHSVCIEGTPYTDGAYYDYHVVMPFLAGDGPAPLQARVLSLGSAAGSFSRLYAHVHPGCKVDRVEIDGRVHELGEDQKLFPGKGAAGKSFADMDARLFVNTTAGPYDVVLVDTYERQFYIPAHLTSVQFFEQVKRILAPGGVVAVNVGGTAYDDAVVETLAGTMAKVFGHALGTRVPGSRNFVLIGRRDKGAKPALLKTVPARGDEKLSEILEHMATARWRTYEAAAEPLDDDRPYLDVLQEEFYAPPLPPDELVAMAGKVDSKEVERQGFALLKEQNMVALMKLLQTASAPTGYLRYLAGHARWALRDPAGAVTEYEAAARLGQTIDPVDMGGARADSKSQLAAADTARRNRWASIVITLLGMVVLVGVVRRTV